jgi:LmbE family N-acetylglucosaminyl deacetylase
MDSSLRLRGRTVVALHAHPDDEAIFSGITLRRLSENGARTVLVVATAGELGAPVAGHSIARLRIAELERSAGLLGVSRLVLLGRRDSGLPGWPSGSHSRALIGADPQRLGRRVAALVDAEGADTLIYDDESGVYGHPDHVVVHRIGLLAARLTGAVSYLTTVDRERLGCGHLVRSAAAAARVAFGRASAEITLKLSGSLRELAFKRAAITAHASQISPDTLPTDQFPETYGTEWFRRIGPAGLLDQLSGSGQFALAA